MSEFEGATCSACDSPLDRHGYCLNKKCGYASYLQDEPGGWLRNQERKRLPAPLGRFEVGCVIANERSMTYRLAGDRGYARATRARHVVFFRTEDHATANGYRRRGGG